jgi:hypothetical protein
MAVRQTLLNLSTRLGNTGFVHDPRSGAPRVTSLRHDYVIRLQICARKPYTDQIGSPGWPGHSVTCARHETSGVGLFSATNVA